MYKIKNRATLPPRTGFVERGGRYQKTKEETQRDAVLASTDEMIVDLAYRVAILELFSDGGDSFAL